MTLFLETDQLTVEVAGLDPVSSGWERFGI
jgi:hypothetical protein